jgi:hypothetical protein
MDNFDCSRLILGRAKVMAAKAQRGYLNVCLAKVAEGDYRTHTQIDALPLEFRRLPWWAIARGRKCHLCVMKVGCALFHAAGKKTECSGFICVPWAARQALGGVSPSLHQSLATL